MMNKDVFNSYVDAEIEFIKKRINFIFDKLHRNLYTIKSEFNESVTFIKPENYMFSSNSNFKDILKNLGIIHDSITK